MNQHIEAAASTLGQQAGHDTLGLWMALAFIVVLFAASMALIAKTER